MSEVPSEPAGGTTIPNVQMDTVHENENNEEEDDESSTLLDKNEAEINGVNDSPSIISSEIVMTPTKEDAIADISRSNSAPPPAEAFRSLPLRAEAILESSTPAEGTSSMSRIYEKSKALGYVQDIDTTNKRNNSRISSHPPIGSDAAVDSVAFHEVNGEEEKKDAKSDIPPISILPRESSSSMTALMPKSVFNPKEAPAVSSYDAITPKTKHLSGDEMKPSEESVDTNNSQEKIDSQLSSSFDYSSSLNRSIEGESPSLSSSNMSATRSLHPRSLASEEGSSQFSTPRKSMMEVHVHNYGAGSRSPSVLSSNSSKGDRKSIEKKEQDRKKRMKHLSMLLDRHHKSTLMNKKSTDVETLEDDLANAGEEDKVHLSAYAEKVNENQQDQAIDKNEEENEMAPLVKGDDEVSKSKDEGDNENIESGMNGYQRFSFDRVERSMSISGASVSTGTTSRKRATLFDSFEKTWSSVSPSEEGYETERLCFASLVSVLLDDIQNRPSKKSKLPSSISRKGGRKQGRNDKASGQVAVPVEVVKLFWKKIVLADDSQTDLDLAAIDVKIDAALATLVEKLRYLVVVDSSTLPFESYLSGGQNVTNSSTMVLYLSHDVYGEYTKRILQSMGLLRDTVEKWHDSFAKLLSDNSVLSYDHNVLSTGHSEKMKDLQTYAGFFLPRHLISSFESASTQFIQEQEEERYINRVSRFVSLMNSSEFLSCRMKIIGDIERVEAVDIVSFDMRASRKNKKTNLQQSSVEEFVLAHWDIINASKIHLHDLERFFTLFIGRFDQIQVVINGDIVERTTATLSMYTSWKEQCLAVLADAKENMKESAAQCGSLYQKGLKEGKLSAEGTTSKVSFKPSSTRKRSTQIISLVRSSTESLGELPKNLNLDAEVYTLDYTDTTTSLVKRTDKSALINMKLAKANPWKHQSRLLGSTNRNFDDPGLGISIASMQLQDALDIDIVTLYLDILYGKVLNMINQSISKQVSVDTESSNMGSVEVLRGPVVTNTKIGLSANSIEIYTNVMKVMSFLLSEDLDDVDENDLMDLGYCYDGDEGDINPSSRIKKLKCDRTEAVSLLEKLKVLNSLALYEMGGYLFDGIKAGHSSSIEMSGLHLLHNLLGNDQSPSENSKPMDYVATGHAEVIELQMKVIQCYHVALSLLSMNTTKDEKKSIGKRRLHVESSDSISEKEHIERFKRMLYASVIHSIGVHYYEQEGNLSAAKTCLEEALTRRRLLLRHLQNEEDDGDYASGSSVSSMSSIASNNKRSVTFDPKYGESRRRRKKGLHPEKVKDDSFRTDVLLVSENSGKKEIDSLELDLSTTLEFLALTSHSLQDYQASLSLFQEALILRALHAGKNSLEVSSLQYNMGVVHDDLGQHESSLGRYGESLRVRMMHLENMTGDFPKVIDNVNGTSYLEDLEATIVLTLRCMGNVYRALHDITNALGSYLKAITLLKEKLKRSTTGRSSGVYQTRSGELGFGKVNGGRQSDLPMPITLFEEMRQGKIMPPIYREGKDRKEKSQSKLTVLSEEDRVRKEIAGLYSTLVSLVNDRKKQKKSGSSRSGYNSSGSGSGSYSSGRTSSSSAHYHHNRNSSNSKISKKKHLNETDDDDCILLDAAFNLGMLTMHFGEFRNALCYFEEALRTLFISNPNESSYESSDSEFSDKMAKRNHIKSKIKARKYDGKAEEGTIYHALAVTHAGLLDHERAVRYYMTALRFYRQHMGMESLKVAGALYDCGLSYWHMSEYNKAGDFWADCLRILLQHGNNSTDACELYVANTLYNLAASKICKGEYGNLYTHTCLDDAFEIFKQLNQTETGEFSIEMAHCYFYLGFAHYSQVPDISSPESVKPLIDEKSDKSFTNSRSVKTTDRADLITKEDYLQYALSCMDEALNIYLSQPNLPLMSSADTDGSQPVGQNFQHPMQAHVAHISGLLYDGLGHVSQALWNFTTALRLMNRVYSQKNIYSASIMQSMGIIFISVNNSPSAMRCFEDSLAITRPLLGASHPTVATCLHNLAGLHGVLTDYIQSINMYSQCLKIRIEYEGNDGAGVAETLLQMGIVTARFSALKRSLDYLEGSFKIRKSRISLLNATYNTSLLQKSKDSSNEIDSTKNTSGDGGYEKNLRIEEAELAKVLYHIGNIRLKNDEPEEAIKCYEDALVIQRELCNFSSGGFAEFVQRPNVDKSIRKHEEVLQDMADTLHNLGWAYEVIGVLEKALACFNETLVLKRSLPHLLGANIPIEEATAVVPLDDHMNKCTSMTSANTLQRIGSIHIKLYNYDIALSYYKTALRIQRRSLGKDHIVVACTLSEMGKIMKQRMKSTYDLFGNDTVGLDKVAMKCFTESLRITQRQFGSNHKAVADVMFDIGSVHDYNNEYMEALSCYESSTQVYSRLYTRILCQRLCDISSGNMMSAINEVEDEKFFPIGFTSNFPNVTEYGVLSTLAKASTKSQDMMTTKEAREMYMKASVALNLMSQKTGVKRTTITSLRDVELIFLRFLEILTIYGVDPLRNTMYQHFGNFGKIFHHVERATNHATITASDTLTLVNLPLIEN